MTKALTKAQIAARLETEAAKFQAQIAAKDKSLAEKEKTLAEQTAKIRQLAIGADVKGSKIMERLKPELRTLLEREMTRAGDLDDEGLVLYKGADGKPFYNSEGKYATREEAPLMLMKELGIDPATVLATQNNNSGSGGKPNGGTGGNTDGGQKKYADMTREEKIAYLKDPNNLKTQGSN